MQELHSRMGEDWQVLVRIGMIGRSDKIRRIGRIERIGEWLNIHSKSCSSCSSNSADDLEFSAEKFSENAKIINFRNEGEDQPLF